MEQIQNLITGLKTSLSELREREKLFIKSQTLQEQADKARTACDKLEDSLEVVKKTKADLKERRTGILRDALKPLEDAVTSLLPRGNAVLSLEDSLFIGWKDGERLVPYNGLSGGEKVFFDGALASALLKDGGQKILVLEGGELDDSNLTATLEKIIEAHPEAQVIMNTCHAPAVVSKDWKVIQLK
jgi:hypothetical protein